MGARQLTSVLAVSLCALVGVLLYCGAPALAARGHVFDTSFGTQGSGDGQLDEPADVAVNESTHNVYVVDEGNNRVEEFSSTGSYIGQFNGSGTLAGEGSAAPTGQFSAPESIAVDNSGDALTDPSAGDVYVADSGHNVIDKFTSTGSYIGQLTEGSPGSTFFGLRGVAVDRNGILWTYQTDGEIDSFSDAVANELLSTREGQVGGDPGFAVDSLENMYVDWDGANSTTVVAKLNSTGSVVTAEIDPGESTTAVAVSPSNNDLYVDNASSIGLFSPEGKLIERLGSGILKGGAGVAVDSSSETVYVADSTTDTVDIFEIEPLSPPVVENEWAKDVASTSATLDAQINPRGSSTEYRFEYGPSISYGTSAPIPDGSIASGFGASNVSIHRAELLADTTYHYRVVVHNELGTVDGPDHTFTTQAAGGQELVLPDGRAWELVSPADKNGALIEPSGTHEDVVQAASDGSGIVYRASEPIGEGTAGHLVGAEILSRRNAGGWGSQDISARMAIPPEGNGAFTLVSSTENYWSFSSDLSFGLLEPGEVAPSQAPEATEQTLYLRNNASEGFLPIETPADVTSGVKFADQAMEFRAATPNLSHVIFATPLALTKEAVAGIEAPYYDRNLYEWSAGRLQLINIFPDNKTRPYVSIGSEEGQQGMTERAVSSDGRWVVWKYGSLENGPEDSHEVSLYARDMVGEKTVQIGGKYPRFETMSSDGSKVFYVETEPGREGAGGDLYVFDTSNGNQTDLTADHGAGEKSAGVQAAVIGASEDGSYVYFVATGVLANGAVSGGNNLYLLHNAGGEWRTTYIATLSSEDLKSWGGGFAGGKYSTSGAALSYVSSSVSPNGHYVAFMSNRSLTGYDNLDAVSGQSDEEVYLYDAIANRLVCVSCDPTGARPVGVFDGSGGSAGLLVDRDLAWASGRGSGDHRLAGSLPTPSQTKGAPPSYRPRYLSNSGRLFFDSPDALVPQDTNGLEDVYEYEPPASGSGESDNCTSAGATFGERPGGCVSLISSGTSASESALMDASENGDDAFFITSSKLTSEDYDTSYDVYDAHVCSTELPCHAEPVSPPACTSGDSCKAAPSPQPEIFGSAPSATFSGTGNIVEAAKREVKPKKHVVKRKKPKRNLRDKKKKDRVSRGKIKNGHRSPVGKSNRKGNR